MVKIPLNTEEEEREIRERERENWKVLDTWQPQHVYGEVLGTLFREPVTYHIGGSSEP